MNEMEQTFKPVNQENLNVFLERFKNHEKIKKLLSFFNDLYKNPYDDEEITNEFKEFMDDEVIDFLNKSLFLALNIKAHLYPEILSNKILINLKESLMKLDTDNLITKIDQTLGDESEDFWNLVSSSLEEELSSIRNILMYKL